MRGSSSIRRPTRNAAASVLYVRKTRRGVSGRHGGGGPATAEAGTVCAILCSGDVEGNTASSPGPPPAATSQVHGSPRMAPLITPRPAPPGEPEATARGARNEDAPAASHALPLPARELELLAAAAHGPWGQGARSKRRRPSSIQTARGRRSEGSGVTAAGEQDVACPPHVRRGGQGGRRQCRPTGPPPPPAA